MKLIIIIKPGTVYAKSQMAQTRPQGLTGAQSQVENLHNICE